MESLTSRKPKTQNEKWVFGRILALPLVLLILIYQRTLSLDHSWLNKFFPYGYCKFHPSCSMYALIVLKTQGVAGIPKIIKRILMCNPFTFGGIDDPYPHHPHQ